MQQIGVTAGGTRLAIIGLTRRGDLKAKLAAFDCGADDIVTIPFAPEELLARVLALLRRSYGDPLTFMPVIKLGDLDIDILKRTVRAGTSELHLTSLEQSLLYLLAANPGRVITREEILDTLWGGGPCGGKHRCGQADPQAAGAAPGRLATAAVHRHRPVPRLQVPADVHRRQPDISGL